MWIILSQSTVTFTDRWPLATRWAEMSQFRRIFLHAKWYKSCIVHFVLSLLRWSCNHRVPMVNKPSSKVEPPDAPQISSINGSIRSILKSYLENYHRIMGNSILHLFSGSSREVAPSRRGRRGAVQPMIPGSLGLGVSIGADDQSTNSDQSDQESIASHGGK